MILSKLRELELSVKGLRFDPHSIYPNIRAIAKYIGKWKEQIEFHYSKLNSDIALHTNADLIEQREHLRDEYRALNEIHMELLLELIDRKDRVPVHF